MTTKAVLHSWALPKVFAVPKTVRTQVKKTQVCRTTTSVRPMVGVMLAGAKFSNNSDTLVFTLRASVANSGFLLFVCWRNTTSGHERKLRYITTSALDWARLLWRNRERTIERMIAYSYKVSEGFLAKPSARVAVEYARLVSAKTVRAVSALLTFLPPLEERKHCNAARGKLLVRAEGNFKKNSLTKADGLDVKGSSNADATNIVVVVHLSAINAHFGNVKNLKVRSGTVADGHRVQVDYLSE